ncbi:MAG: adenine phosphoribosyltransferase [Spirochaetaceae bacterium]|jgi:adenine phosphoribosyltransferase|nr:adenine phosphoribosyltransferase [Spirochaetaceae bacterium]
MSKQFSLDEVIRKIPDFPKPGVLFYDVTGILVSPEAFRYCIDTMVSMYRNENIDAVAAIESRGFVFAAPFAEKLGIPLILVRKKGKLPGKTYSCKYQLEYGEAELEVQVDDVRKDQQILVMDDLIATGGTFKATQTVLEMGGASVKEFFGVVGLPFLNYHKVLDPIPVRTLVEYYGE